MVLMIEWCSRLSGAHDSVVLMIEWCLQEKQYEIASLKAQVTEVTNSRSRDLLDLEKKLGSVLMNTKATATVNSCVLYSSSIYM